MKFINKVFVIFTLLLLLEINTIYCKIARIKRKSHNKRKNLTTSKAILNNGEKSECEEAVEKGFSNFVFGLINGFIGFDEAPKTCKKFNETLSSIASSIGFKKVDPYTPNENEKVDFQYLKVLNMTPDQRKELSKERIDEFNKKNEELAKITNPTTCLTSLNNFFIDNVMTAFELINSLNFVQSGIDSIKTNAEPVYCKVCYYRNFAFMIYKVILSVFTFDLKQILFATKLMKDIYNEINRLKKLFGFNTNKPQETQEIKEVSPTLLEKMKNFAVEKLVDMTITIIDTANYLIPDNLEDSFYKTAFDFILKYLSDLKSFADSNESTQKVLEFIKDKFLGVVKFFSSDLYKSIKEQGFIDLIISSVVKAIEKIKNTYKSESREGLINLYENLINVEEEKIGIFKTIKQAFDCFFDTAKTTLKTGVNIYKVFKNMSALSTLIGIITGSGSSGIGLPLAFGILAEIIFAIACDGQAFEKIYYAIKYAFTNQSSYSSGAAVGLAINLFANPKSFVVDFIHFLVGKSYDFANNSLLAVAKAFIPFKGKKGKRKNDENDPDEIIAGCSGSYKFKRHKRIRKFRFF